MLGIAPTDDRREIRKAYTKALKALDVDADPASFFALREAMETASQWGTETPWYLEDSDLLTDSDDLPIEDGFADEFPEATDETEDWDRQWRPSLPPDGKSALDQACAELERLLFDEDQADAGRIAQLGAAILADPELENVDRLTAVEQWLAQAIPASSPRSDPLIGPAIARFGWDKVGRTWRRDFDVDEVLSRRRDLRWLAACSRPLERHHAAIAELRGPARERINLRELGLTREVRDFLYEMDQDHPSLCRNFDEAKLAWWRAYFRGRHLPVDFWPLLILIPPTLTFAALIFVAVLRGNLLAGLLFYPFAVLLTAGAMLLTEEISARARERAERRMYDDSPGGAEWIVLGAMLLPPASILGLNISALGWSLAAASLAMLAAAHWLGPASSSLDFMFVPDFKEPALPTAAFIASIAIALALAPPMVPALILPVGVMCWLAYWGADAVAALLTRHSRWFQVTAMLAASALVLGSAVIVYFAHTDWPLPAYSTVLIPVALVAAHLATSASLVAVILIEWPIRLIALILYFVVGRFFAELGQTVVLGLCVYGIAVAIVKLGVSLVQLRSAPQEQG